MEYYTEEEKLKSETSYKVTSYAKIYLWFGLGILISGLVGFSLPYLLLSIYGTDLYSLYNCYSVMTIISLIITFPLSIVINLSSFKSSAKLSTTCYILYSVAFGILLSSLLSFVEAELSLYAFLITGGVMFVMGIFGALLKNRIKNMYLLIITLLISALSIFFINFFLMSETIYWIVTYIMLVVILLFTAFDIARINRMVDLSQGGISNGLAIYCAYLLYSDFIIIFIRVLMVLAADGERR